MKTLKYSELTEREQTELLQLKIQELLSIGWMFSLGCPYKNHWLEHQKEVRPYILYCTEEDYKQEIDNKAKILLEAQVFLPLPRNLDATIIYREEV